MSVLPAVAPGVPVPARLVDVLAEAIAVVQRPVVLIDGRSGSGKTTLAGPLAARLGAALVHMDALYQGGWDGLEGGSAHVRDSVLASSEPRWRAWNWVRDEPGPWHDVDPSVPLVIEGSGSLSAANRRLASYAIWVELADDAHRKSRALARDGESYAPHWDRWAAQEATFAAREQPWLLADAVVDGAAWTLRFSREHTA